MQDGNIKKWPVSGHHDKGKGVQGWLLACGVRRKINLIVRADFGFVGSVAQERQKSSNSAKRGKHKGYLRIKGSSLIRFGEVTGLE